jgi:prophage antirepressor-like protein
MTDSIVKVFAAEEIRFVTHPENLFGFGIVAADLANVLELSSGKDMARSIDDEWKGAHNMPTLGGTQSMTVIWEPGVYQILSKSRSDKAKPFQKWLFSEVLPSIRKTGSYSVDKPAPVKLLPQVTDETVKIHTDSIKWLTENGDLQLSQLLKVRLGNLILAEQQGLLKPANIPQYEGAVDVAIRLGFKVPKNYEGSLGSHVKIRHGHLTVGKDNRYSLASGKQIPANMYPFCDPDIEKTVLDYCISKSFYHQDIDHVA